MLKIELEDVNPEINYDRDKIVNIWNQKFPNSKIPAVIDEIEEYFQGGELTDTKFATCIGRIRVLISEVTKELASETSCEKKDKKIAGDAKEHAVFDYLKSQKIISQDEWQVVRSLYAMASNTGSHALASNREYARLIKNMTYEFVLLLLNKGEKGLSIINSERQVVEKVINE